MTSLSIQFTTKKEWCDYGQRCAAAALPFITLYKPIGVPLTLGLGAIRIAASSNSFQTAVAIAALAGTVFKHPAGILISSVSDLVVETSHLINHLQKRDYEKALSSSLNLANQALYLALIMKGGLELSIASLAIQIALGIYHAQSELRQGHYIEGTGHIAMALLRGHQMKGEIKALRASRIFYAEIITKKLDPLKFAPPKDGCRIFLIRHAETEWNAEGKSQGWNDIPLNEEGKRQAALLGECFSNLSIEQIYASALSRAVETSQAIGKHHPDAAIVYDKALRFYDPDLKIPQQNETIEQMEARITQEIIDGATAYIKDICAKSQGQNIVFITHGKVIRSLLYALTGGILDPNKFKVGNTSMVRLFCDGDQLALENRLTNR